MVFQADCIGCVDFNPAVIPEMIVQLIATAISIIMAITLMITAYQRKKLATTALMLTIVLNTGVMLVTLISNLQGFFWGYYLPWHIWVNVLTFFLMYPFAICFFICCKELFLKDIPKWIYGLYIVWGIVGAVLVVLPQNNWGVVGGDQTLQLISQVNLSVYVLITFIIAIRGSFHTASRLEKSAERTALRLISCAAIFSTIGLLLPAIAMLAIDILGKYNIFTTLEWACAFVGILTFYLGFSPPAWLKKRFEKE